MENILNYTQGVFATTVRRWADLTLNVPPDLLARPAAPGEWSALQCLQHLVDTEQFVFPVRVKAFLAGQDFAAFHPESEGRPPSADPIQLSAEFSRLRTESLALLSGLKPADLARTAKHSELGTVSLDELLHEWVGHDLMHTVQAERALLQLFIQACGPWRSYFADHDIQRK